MKIIDGLLEGKDISIQERKRLILVSSSTSLEDILHVITIYFSSPHINFDKGIMRFTISRGTYDHEPEGLILISGVYQVTCSQCTLMIIGDENTKFSEFINNLLKLKGMKELI